MKLSNLSFFHRYCHLQSAHALHDRFYLTLQNQQATCLNPFALQKKSTSLKLASSSSQQTHLVISDIELIYDDMPAHETAQAPANQATLDMQQLLKTEHTDERGLWKLGRGAIEKVDRNTGDIFHLCEDADIMSDNNLHCSVA